MQPANKRFLQLVREVDEQWRTPSGVPWLFFTRGE